MPVRHRITAVDDLSFATFAAGPSAVFVRDIEKEQGEAAAGAAMAAPSSSGKYKIEQKTSSERKLLRKMSLTDESHAEDLQVRHTCTMSAIPVRSVTYNLYQPTIHLFLFIFISSFRVTRR